MGFTAKQAFYCLTMQLAIALANCHAQEPAVGGSQNATKTAESVEVDPLIEPRVENEAELLVDKMLHGTFSERQMATAHLLELGVAALPVLKREAGFATGAIRDRLNFLRQQIHDIEFERRMEVLKQSLTLENAKSFAGWERFEAMADSGDDSISLFVEIQAAEPRLFSTAMFDPENLAVILEERSALLSRQLNGRTDGEFPAAAYAGILLLGSDPQVRLLRATSTNISDGLADERFSRLISDGKSRRVLEALVSSWITRPGISVERPLLFAIEHQMAAGRTVARRIIESGSNRFDMILAIVTVAALGDESDVPMLEKLFHVNSVLWPPKGQPAQRVDANGQAQDTNYRVQTCDIALVAALHLRKADFTRFNLKIVRHEQTVFAINSLGFSSDESRQAVITAYRAAFMPQ